MPAAAVATPATTEVVVGDVHCDRQETTLFRGGHALERGRRLT